MDSLAYLERANRATLQSVYVLHGDEAFLKRHVLAAIRKRVFGDGDSDFGYATYPGDKAEFAAIHNELETLPFLCPRRLVVVDSADPFVTRHRQALEAYVGTPAESGILVLDVKTWPANTRLAKLVSSDATIVCKRPPRISSLIGASVGRRRNTENNSLRRPTTVAGRLSWR